MSKWFAGLKSKLIFILTGAAMMAAIANFFNSFMKKRAVKKSQAQADKDVKTTEESTRNAEKSWVDQGKVTDEEKKRDI